jgi:hypothetical protein
MTTVCFARATHILLLVNPSQQSSSNVCRLHACLDHAVRPLDKNRCYSERVFEVEALPDPKARKIRYVREAISIGLNAMFSFAIQASSDMRFKIRHAPVPAYGSPWPMPKTYLPMKTTFRVIPGDLQFRMVGGESCEILEWNFRRIHLNMFGTDNDLEEDFEPDIVSDEPVSHRPVLRWFNVTVLKECTEFPYLEMNESCESVHIVFFIFRIRSINFTDEKTDN